MRWSPALFTDFQKRWGYDLKLHLPSLFEDVGDWKRVRHNYYQLLLELFIERWSKPWYRYCENHNLIWTGHYWEHGWPNPEHGSDNMAMYAWHQMPGIDMLFNALDERPDQFGNVRAVKELASVANQLGRERTLSETYGAAGWELRFEDMKRLGDWEYVLGVNFMNQHLSYMTLVGDRKHDFPQSFSYHTPWWPYYKTLADYFARLSLALSSGEQRNTILIIEPTTTTWMYASWGESPEKLDELGDTFNSFLKQLEQRHIEYDLGSEHIIADHGSVEGDRFVVGKRAYSLVVLPAGTESLNGTTVRLLQEYVRHGGRVVCLGDPPARVDGAPSGALVQLANADSARWITAASLNEPSVAELLKSPDYELLDAASVSGQVFHMRRMFEDGQLLFFTNFSLKEASAFQCRVSGTAVLQLNTFTGEIEPYPGQSGEEAVSFSVSLAPGGSLLLFVSDHLEQPPASQPVWQRDEVSPAGPITVERLSPNVLTLDYCDLTMNDSTEHGLYFYTAANKIWQAHGFDDNPWVSSSQYKTNILDKGNFADDSGFDVTYHFQVLAGVATDSLRAVIERPELWNVAVNRQPVDAVQGKWWLDRQFGVYDIGQFVHKGDNTITLSRRPMHILAELEPVYLIGDFQLMSLPHGWQVVPDRGLILGEWRQQGLPFYAEAVSYQRTYSLRKGSRYVVQAPAWYGTVIEVRVNGEQAGIIGWQPYELEITDWVCDGDNTIELRVVGSLKNTLGPHHNVSRRGIVTPWSFKYAPAGQPAGLDYDLDGYGLFDEFAVVRLAGPAVAAD